jgi:hypothetical protein
MHGCRFLVNVLPEPFVANIPREPNRQLMPGQLIYALYDLMDRLKVVHEGQPERFAVCQFQGQSFADPASGARYHSYRRVDLHIVG